jgi:hypothetical protein
MYVRDYTRTWRGGWRHVDTDLWHYFRGPIPPDIIYDPFLIEFDNGRYQHFIRVEVENTWEWEGIRGSDPREFCFEVICAPVE